MTTSDIKASGWLPLDCGPGVRAASSCIRPTKGMIELPERKLITVRQIHSAKMIVTKGNDNPCAEGDAIVTMIPDLAVGVRTADCVPIVINAPEIGAVAAVHAGWRGTISGIVSVVTKYLIDSGASAEQIYAAIGPHICADCYEVSPELATDFSEAGYGRFIITEGIQRPHLDLGGINCQQLIDCGVPESHIAVSPHCTLCTEDEIFPSYRRNATTDRLYTVIYRPDTCTD